MSLGDRIVAHAELGEASLAILSEYGVDPEQVVTKAAANIARWRDGFGVDEFGSPDGAWWGIDPSLADWSEA